MSHRLDKKPPDDNNLWPIIIKFQRQNVRAKFLENKKTNNINKKMVSVTKSLTKTRMGQLQKGKKELSFQNLWYNNGKKRFYIYWF